MNLSLHRRNQAPQCRLLADTGKNNSLSIAYQKRLQEAVEKFATKLAAAVHSMCWLSWSANKSPDRVDEDRVKQYNDEIHLLLTEISGLKSTVIGLAGGRINR